MSNKVLLAYVRKSILARKGNKNGKDGKEFVANDSPEIQRLAIERWNRENGSYQLEWFEDLDETGLDENRPDWQRLLGRVHDPDVVGVIVLNYTKTHRNVKDYLTFYDTHLAPNGKALIDVTNPMLDLRTADGRFMATVFMAGAEHHARKTRELIKKKVHFTIYVKNRHWGAIPFGCDRDKDTKHLIPTAAAYLLNSRTGEALPFEGITLSGWEVRYYFDALRSLFDTYSLGQYSLSEMAQILDKAGWRHWEKDRKTPKKFTKLSVHSILRHWRLYAGELPPSPTTPIVEHRNRPVLPGGHRPILPVELCQRVGSVMHNRRLVHTGPHPKTMDFVYLLSGLIVCDRCGQRMAGQHTEDRGSRRYYRHMYAKNDCQEPMTSMATLENAILEIMAGVALLAPLLEGVIQKIKLAITASSDAGSDKVLTDLAHKKMELERLANLHIRGTIDLPTYEKLYQGLKAEIDTLEAQITKPQFNTGNIEQITDRVMGYLEDLVTEPSRTLQKAILHSFLAQIRIREGRIVHITPAEWTVPFFGMCKMLPVVWPTEQFTIDLTIFDVESLYNDDTIY